MGDNKKKALYVYDIDEEEKEEWWEYPFYFTLALPAIGLIFLTEFFKKLKKRRSKYES